MYDIFLSYKTKNIALARLVKKVLLARNLTVFLDQEDIVCSIYSEILKAIKGSKVMVCLVCKEYYDSLDCIKECIAGHKAKCQFIVMKLEEHCEPPEDAEYAFEGALIHPCYTPDLLKDRLPRVVAAAIHIVEKVKKKENELTARSADGKHGDDKDNPDGQPPKKQQKIGEDKGDDNEDEDSGEAK